MFPIFTRLHPNDQDKRSCNPGDYYIAMGVQYIIASMLGREPEWMLIDKFNRDHALSMVEDVRRAGFMIYAGMPQYNRFSDWSFWYDDGVWRDLVAPAGARGICLAGGAGFSSTSISPDEFAKLCFEDEKTREIMEFRREHVSLFTVRDPYAKAFLDAFSIESSLLPCTALFAGHRARSIADGGTCIVVPPDPGSLCVGDGDRDFRLLAWTRRVCAALRDSGRDPMVVCHCGHEYEVLRQQVDLDVRYSNNYLWQLRMFEGCSEMIGARIHAVLPAYGMGGARCVGVSVDTRGSALSLLPGVPVRSFYDTEHSPEVLVADLDVARRSDPAWVEETRVAYVELLMKSLAETCRIELLTHRR